MQRRNGAFAGGENGATEYCLRCLDRKDYTVEGLRRRLYGKFSSEDITAAVAKMVELGFIDDAVYAEHKARYMLLEEKRSRAATLQRLLYDGVDRETATEAVNAVEYDGAKQAYELLQKKYRGGTVTSEDKQKAVMALLRRGFTYDDIRSALAKMKEDTDFE